MDNLANQYFYHNDAQGGAEEIRLRREIEALLDEMDISDLRLTDPALLDRVVPVPNTTNILGLLNGDVELEVIYKKFGDLQLSEFSMLIDFRKQYISAREGELGMLHRAARQKEIGEP